MITFAVIGHNEAATLPRALDAAMTAADAADHVLFVDSASTDNSAEIAQARRVDVIASSLGKGNAIAAAFAAARSDWLCLLDADIFGSENNIAALLAERVRQAPGAALYLGDFDDAEPGTILSNTWAIYEPLVGALFPEAAGRFGTKPLSGFRALRTDLVAQAEQLPPDFGIEAHLNIVAALSGQAIEVVPLGKYEGRFLYKPKMGLEIGGAVLDCGVTWGRLSRETRPDWQAWLERVVSVIASYKGAPDERPAYLRRLDEVRRAALPSTVRTAAL